MKPQQIWLVLLTIYIIIIIVSGSAGCNYQKCNNIWTIPHLPHPIAEESVLITSAGQSTDAYIVAEIANKLMIHNFFRPQAGASDLHDVNSLAVVVGYSPIGMKSSGISLDEEKRRLARLLEKAKKDNLIVLVLFISGKHRRGPETDELLELVSTKGDYLIGIMEANYDNFLMNLAKKHALTLTLVKDINNVREPFASAFR